jgi:hypothetical protein
MSNKREPGCIVKLDDGRLGRTKNSNALINGKVPVYLATKTYTIRNMEVPVTYAENGILCDPEKVKSIGNID